MCANFFSSVYSVTQNGCSRMRWKPVLAQFLGGPLLPHLLQTPEISQLLFVPAASPLTIRKLFLRILCLYYSSSWSALFLETKTKENKKDKEAKRAEN